MEFKLLRKPRPPKLHRVDIATATEPEEFLFDDSVDTDTVSSIRTTDRDLIDPNLYIKNQAEANYKPVEPIPMTSVRFDLSTVDESTRRDESHHFLPDLVKSPAAGPGQLFQMTRGEKFIAIPYESMQSTGGVKRLCNTLCTNSRTSILDVQKENTFFSHLGEDAPKKSSSFSGRKFVHRLPTLKSAVNLELDDQFKVKPAVHSAPHRNPGYLKKLKPLGPDPLPPRALRHHKEDLEIKKIIYQNMTYNDMDLYRTEQTTTAGGAGEESFILNDFLYNPKDITVSRPVLIDNNLKRAIVSDHTTNQIETLLEKRVNSEKNSSQMTVQTLQPEIDPFENRKPFRQALIEMASFFKDELSQNTNIPLKTKFNKVSKWHPDGPKTELIIYEEKTDRHDFLPPYLDRAKTESLTEVAEQNEPEDGITPADLAVIDCLLRDGMTLSLKGFFIQKLPDLSSLNNSLIYINLSFNNFQEFPRELLEMKRIECIKLRNNPIKTLPDSISILENLKMLVVAYCQLDYLPSAIYGLENLIYLDVSYNRLTVVDEDIVKLTNLRTLNYEGNELQYLPSCMLKMYQLQSLNVKNNYLHPLLWTELMRKRQPPSLFSLAAHSVTKAAGDKIDQLRKLSPELRVILKKISLRCDCCHGKRFTNELKVIRPCLKIFGVKYLPFLFQCCSFECCNAMKRKSIK